MNGIARINIFAPTKKHAKQQIVWDALKENRWVMVRAGRKWRKTSLAVSWLAKMALTTGLTCPFIAPNRTQAKNIVWDDHIQRLLIELRKKGVPYKSNEQELSIKLPGGGKIQLLGIENKDSLRGISNWGAVAGDEYDDWEEDIWPTIIRPNLITHKAPALITGTPKGYRNLYRIEKQGMFKAFHFTSMDNPDLDRQELEDLKKEYMAMGMGAYRQEILAQYEKPQGTVYEEWDVDTQYLPLEYSPDLPLHLSWDFGVNDPTSIIFFQPHGEELRIIDYYEASNANITHFVDWIKKRGYKRPDVETGDIAGRQRSLITGKSVIAELRNLGHNIRSTPIPDVESQVRNAHRTVPKLYVSNTNPRCERFRDCMLNYRYPKISESRVDQENENPIHDEFSHAMRAFEYYCWNIRQGKVGAMVHPNETTKMRMTAEFVGDKQVGLDISKFGAPNQASATKRVGAILRS